YDYYLDVNACLYGLHAGSEPLHVMYDPVEGMVMMVNNGFRTQRDLMLQVRSFDMTGKSKLLTQQFFEIGPTIAKKYLPIRRAVDDLRKDEGVFLSLRLLDVNKRIVSENLYWLPDSTGNYSGLQEMPRSWMTVEAKLVGSFSTTTGTGMQHIEVTLHNPENDPIAFFNRISLVDPLTKKRLLPVFYSDNYFPVLPGETKTILVDYTPEPATSGAPAPLISVRGWNTEEKYYSLKTAKP
ncbi:MAG TPA: hypothetical protein VNU72_09825, partial [Puia sp.]|nr:hypothetical protein [Puia sp.]